MDKHKLLEQMYLLLNEGQVFKNYKDLCNYLKQPIATGKSKQYQLERFENYFEFHREGHKYIIDNVYSEPLTSFSKGTYSNLIQKLLLDYMARIYIETDNKSILVSKNRLYQALYMINNNYQKYKHNYNELSDTLNVTMLDIKEFYMSIDNKYNGIIKTALNDLRKKRIIDYNISKVIVYSNDDNRAWTHKVASEFERDYILEIEYGILKEIGCKDIIEVILKDKYAIFITKVLSIINGDINNITYEYTRIEYYYNAYDIVFIDNIVSEAERFILDNNELSLMLNDEIVNRLKESYNDKHDIALSIPFYEYCELDKYKLKRIDNRLNKDYTNNGHKLIDYTIKRK